MYLCRFTSHRLDWPSVLGVLGPFQGCLQRRASEQDWLPADGPEEQDHKGPPCVHPTRLDDRRRLLGPLRPSGLGVRDTVVLLCVVGTICCHPHSQDASFGLLVDSLPFTFVLIPGLHGFSTTASITQWGGHHPEEQRPPSFLDLVSRATPTPGPPAVPQGFQDHALLRNQ